MTKPMMARATDGERYRSAVANFEAVLFDWMLTLAHYPSPAEHVAEARRALSRPDEPEQVDAIVRALASARLLPDVQKAEAIEDTSTRAHHRAEHLLYERAGVDAQLASEMYSLLGRPSFHPCYPDVEPVLAALHGHGIKIGVVSDIHVDLRTHAEQFGFGSYIDAWALSYEIGVQKPDHRIFTAALDQLGADPTRTLMVGDRPTRDGAAADLGLTCLVLPAPTAVVDRGLHAVLRLVDLG